EKKLSIVDKGIYNLKVLYKNLILWALSYKKSVILGIVTCFFLSLIGFKFIPFIFFPDSDRNMITVDINLPQGTKIEATKEVVNRLEDFVLENLFVTDSRPDGITDWSSYIGKGPESYDLGYSPDEPDDS